MAHELFRLRGGDNVQIIDGKMRLTIGSQDETLYDFKKECNYKTEIYILFGHPTIYFFYHTYDIGELSFVTNNPQNIIRREIVAIDGCNIIQPKPFAFLHCEKIGGDDSFVIYLHSPLEDEKEQTGILIKSCDPHRNIRVKSAKSFKNRMLTITAEVRELNGTIVADDEKFVFAENESGKYTLVENAGSYYIVKQMS